MFTYIVRVCITKALLNVPCRSFVKLNLHVALDLCFDYVELDRVVAAAKVDLTEDVLKDLTGTLFVLLMSIWCLDHFY